ASLEQTSCPGFADQTQKTQPVWQRSDLLHEPGNMSSHSSADMVFKRQYVHTEHLLQTTRSSIECFGRRATIASRHTNTIECYCGLECFLGHRARGPDDSSWRVEFNFPCDQQCRK